MGNYLKATKEDYFYMNDYFKETGWTIEVNTEVLIFYTIEEVAKYLGVDIQNKTYEDIEEAIDTYRNVWFDGEKTSRYYVIVQ